MATTIPIVNDHWPLARILVSSGFNLGAGVGGWRVLPMWAKGPRKYGYELLSFSRVCLPAVGECKFRYHYGLIDGDMVGAQSSASRLLSGATWDPSQDNAGADDLLGYEVRIQLAPYTTGTPAWRTEWWGQIEYQSDEDWPAAEYPAGTRVYHCVDGFYRTKRQPMNRHSAYVDGKFFVDVAGHPGYNVGGDGLTRGNKNSATATGAPAAQITNLAIEELGNVGDVKYLTHSPQGSTDATIWTDLEACEHALRITRGVGDPILSFAGTTGLLSTGTTAWRISESDTVWDFIAGRVCKRQRGRGVVYVDWADDTAAPMGPLTVRLKVNPQVLDPVTYTTAINKTGDITTSTVNGATAAGTTVTVDLVGDHRAIPGSYKLGGRAVQRYDSVESLGERIQLLVTLSYYDGTDVSLSKRWSDSAQTTFAALASAARIDDAWRPICQLHGLPYTWAGSAKDHNGGANFACDFRCNDSGTLATSIFNLKLTSPVLTRILPDLPLLEGYDYSTSPPTRKVGTSEFGQPGRRPPLALVRVASDRYLTGDQLARPVSIAVTEDGVLVYAHGEQPVGTRVIGDTTSTLGSVYELSQLGITVGVELPHRVRFRNVRSVVNASGTAVELQESQIRRKLVLEYCGLHLWLAHSGAIWDIDSTTVSGGGAAGRRAAATASGPFPGLLRDDRPALSLIHSLACSWYLADRQTASWGLKACGFLPSFDKVTDVATQATTTQTYPTLGQLVTDLSAGGQIHTINTPITAITYDHQTGVTEWETDWQELDFQ